MWIRESAGKSDYDLTDCNDEELEEIYNDAADVYEDYEQVNLLIRNLFQNFDQNYSKQKLAEAMVKEPCYQETFDKKYLNKDVIYL